MDTRDTFLTRNYRGIYIQSCCNRTTKQEEVFAFVGEKKLEGRSIPSMERRIRTALKAQ